MFAIQSVERIDEEVREPVWQDLALCNDGSGSMTELFFSESIDFTLYRSLAIRDSGQVKNSQ